MHTKQTFLLLALLAPYNSLMPSAAPLKKCKALLDLHSAYKNHIQANSTQAPNEELEDDINKILLRTSPSPKQQVLIKASTNTSENPAPNPLSMGSKYTDRKTSKEKSETLDLKIEINKENNPTDAVDLLMEQVYQEMFH